MSLLTMKTTEIEFLTVKSGAMLLEDSEYIYIEKKEIYNEQLKELDYDVFCSVFSLESKSVNKLSAVGFLKDKFKHIGLAILKDFPCNESMKLKIVKQKTNLKPSNIYHTAIELDVSELEDFDELVEDFNYTKESLSFKTNKKMLEEIQYHLQKDLKIFLTSDVHDNAIYLTNDDNEILAELPLSMNNRYLLLKITEQTIFELNGTSQSKENLFSDDLDLIINVWI